METILVTILSSVLLMLFGYYFYLFWQMKSLLRSIHDLLNNINDHFLNLNLENTNTTDMHFIAVRLQELAQGFRNLHR